MNENLQHLYWLVSHNLNSLELGSVGELIMCEHLRAQGYETQYQKLYHRGDLLTYDDNGKQWKIEVKTAKRANDGRWYYCISKNDLHGKTNACNSDLVALLQIGKVDIDLYVIPSQFLQGQTKVTLPTVAPLTRSKYRHFYQNIRHIDLFTRPFAKLGVAQ